jgi:hypothetical protein
MKVIKSCVFKVCKHSKSVGHCTFPNNTSILAKKFKCMDRIIREGTEVEPYPNMNREGWVLPEQVMKAVGSD